MNSPLSAWRTPLLLFALCVAPFVKSAPPAEAALLQALRGGDCEALAVLAAHHPEALTLKLMMELSKHDDELIRELVAHQAWVPHIEMREQLGVCATLEPRELRDRVRVWSEGRTTSRDTLTRADLASYWLTRTP